MKNALIYSSGLTTRTILDILKNNNDGSFEGIVGLIDDDLSKLNHSYFGKNVLGDYSSIESLKRSSNVTSFLLGLGSVKHIRLRELKFEAIKNTGLTPFNCISNRSYIASDTTIGAGILILPFAMIGSGAHIGDNSIITASISILENCKVGNNVHIGSNSFLGGACTVGENTYIGPGTTVVSGVTIGKNALIGAGSVVLKDVPDGSFGYGNPFIVRGINKYYP